MECVSGERIEAMLATALGASAGSFLKDPAVIELMLNPDGALWLDELGKGRRAAGVLSKEDAARVIYIVASSIGAVCNKETPIISAELPGTGSRFQGMLPPVVSSPVFTIRKKAIKLFSLSDYVKKGIMSEEQKSLLEMAVEERKNILIAGGTSSGKTTLANAILAEIAASEDRLVIIEDTLELQCEASDFVSLRTKEGVASMTDLLKSTLRLRPDRIVIGEVRGPEALALLKAWNTGHPGGLATIHADSASKALTRMEQLIEESGVKASKALIADAVNVVVFIEKTNMGRLVREVKEVGFEGESYLLEA